MAELPPDPPGVSPPNGCEPTPTCADEALEMTRSLIDAVQGTSVSRLVVRAGPIHIEVESNEAPVDSVIATAQHHIQTASPPAQPLEDVPSAAEVRAPLVGVFYRRADPGQPPMVAVGDRVDAGNPLAIVEAMKMMNEVVAGVSGTIVGIHAEDQELVEFDQLLFTIEAAPHG